MVRRPFGLVAVWTRVAHVHRLLRRSYRWAWARRWSLGWERGSSWRCTRTPPRCCTWAGPRWGWWALPRPPCLQGGTAAQLSARDTRAQSAGLVWTQSKELLQAFNLPSGLDLMFKLSTNNNQCQKCSTKSQTSFNLIFLYIQVSNFAILIMPH